MIRCSVGMDEETASRNLEAALRRPILQWIFDSLAELPGDVIKKSFKSCAFNLPVDGSEGYPLLLYFPVSFTCQVGLPWEEGHPFCLVGLPS